jgi:hypothetical protein
MTQSTTADGSHTTVFSDGRRFDGRLLTDGGQELRQFDSNGGRAGFSPIAPDGTVYGRSETLYNIAGSSTYAEFQHNRITHIEQYSAGGVERYDIEYVGDTMRIAHAFPGSHSQTVTEIQHPDEGYLDTIDGARYVMEWADPSKQPNYGIAPEATHVEGPPQVSDAGAAAIRARGLGGSLQDFRR